MLKLQKQFVDKAVFCEFGVYLIQYYTVSLSKKVHFVVIACITSSTIVDTSQVRHIVK